MINKVYDPGDIKIIGFTLTNYNSSATKDIRGQVISLSIFEDMEAPSIYVEVMLKDGVNLVKDFPIIGEETLTISFLTPGRDNITNYSFKIYSVTGTGTDASNQSSVYTLKGVTNEHFTNSIRQVERSYKDTVSSIVSSIIRDDLNTNKTAFVEETRGIVPLTVPRMSPFQAIDMLRQRAVAKRPSGGVFVFFENQFGYNFSSIEKLMEDGRSNIGSKVFTHSPDVNSDTSRQTYAYRNIIQLEQLSKFDTVEKLSGGMFNNVVRSYDLLTKKFNETKFNLSEQSANFVYSDANPSITSTHKTVSAAESGSPTYFFTPKDSSKGEDFIPDLMGYRHAFVLMFNQTVTRCLVHGDNYLTVGDVVTLKLPDTSGTTEKKLDDKRYSGNYLITKLRHIIVYEDNKFKHQIVFDCNRVGIGA
jgi:hypothetical protein